MNEKTGGFGWLPVVGLLGALLVAPTPASAFEPVGEVITKRAIHPKKVEEARAHYVEALKLYDEGAFVRAKDEFDKAYALAPSYKLLYNQGLVSTQLNDPAQAIHSFESYLAQGAWEIPDSRVAEVTKLLADLSPRVATALVTSNVPGAQLTVDGQFVGQTPIEEGLILNPGQHSISAALAGRVTDQKVVTASAGETVTVALELKPEPIPIPYARLGVLAVLFGAVVFMVVRAVRSTPVVARPEDAPRPSEELQQ